METKCPNCISEDILFLGLHREGYDKEFQNKWECRSCKNEFTTEISEQDKLEQQ